MEEGGCAERNEAEGQGSTSDAELEKGIPERIVARLEMESTKMAVNSAGTMLAAGARGGFLQIHNLETGFPARRLTMRKMQRVASLSWGASGATLLAASSDGRLHLHGVPHNEVLLDLRAQGSLREAHMHPSTDDKCLLIPDELMPAIAELQEGSIHSLVACEQAPFEALRALSGSYSPDGNAIFLGSPDGRLGILGDMWGAKGVCDCGIVKVQPSSKGGKVLVLGEDGAIRLLSGCERSRLRHGDLSNLATLSIEDPKAAGTNLPFSDACFSDSGRLALGANENCIFCFRADTGSLVRVLEGPEGDGDIVSLAWTPKRESLLCLTSNSTLLVWFPRAEERFERFSPGFRYLKENVQGVSRQPRSTLDSDVLTADLDASLADVDISSSPSAGGGDVVHLPIRDAPTAGAATSNSKKRRRR